MSCEDKPSTMNPESATSGIPSEYFVTDHRVRGYEAGFAGNLKFVNCLHYLQEAAECQADAMGIGLEHLKGRGLLWVLSRYHIRLHRYPRMGDRVRVASWPCAWERLFAVREFVFMDGADQRYGEASSAWLLLEAKNFHPVRPQEHLPAVPLFERRELETQFAPLPAVTRIDATQVFQVRMHDLDVNRHVNNAVYVEWALEAAPSELWKHHRPVEIEVRFSAMAFHGDSITVEVEVDPSGESSTQTLLHRIVRTRDQQELTRIRSRWQRYA